MKKSIFLFAISIILGLSAQAEKQIVYVMTVTNDCCYKALIVTTNDAGDYIHHDVVTYGCCEVKNKTSNPGTNILDDPSTRVALDEAIELFSKKEIAAKKGLKLMVYPNPTVESFQVSFTSDFSGQAIITIQDQYMREYLNKQIPMVKGVNSIQEDSIISTLPIGNYFVTVQTSEWALTNILVVIK